MNWDNYGKGKGKWEVDHIIPSSLFEYKTANSSEFRECWTLNNLQPLECTQNVRKRDRVNLNNLIRYCFLILKIYN